MRNVAFSMKMSNFKLSVVFLFVILIVHVFIEPEIIETSGHDTSQIVPTLSGYVTLRTFDETAACL